MDMHHICQFDDACLKYVACPTLYVNKSIFLWVVSADDKLVIIFLIFLRKRVLKCHANCLLRKRQSTFSGNKIKKKYFKLSPADILPGPSCSKHRQVNELVSGQNVNCSSKYNI